MSSTPPSAATIVIFGGSGDLARRKLVPALFGLHCQGQLAPETAIVGSARSVDSDDAWRADLRSALAEFGRTAHGDEEWGRFAARLFHFKGDLKQTQSFVDLKVRLEALEGERGLPGNRLYFLAIPPSGIGDAAARLVRRGRRVRCGWVVCLR